jgi:hypothetical protein
MADPPDAAQLIAGRVREALAAARLIRVRA